MTTHHVTSLGGAGKTLNPITDLATHKELKNKKAIC